MILAAYRTYLVDVCTLGSIPFEPVRTRPASEPLWGVHTFHVRKTGIDITFHGLTSEFRSVSGHSLRACAALISVLCVYTCHGSEAREVFTAYGGRDTSTKCPIPLHTLRTISARVSVRRVNACDPRIAWIRITPFHPLTASLGGVAYHPLGTLSTLDPTLSLSARHT